MYDMYLAHHGILGQKWGVRRFQNPDGSLTSAGKLRYAPDGNGGYRKLTSSERRAAEKAAKKRTAALDKARKARAEKAEYDKEKKEAIKSGDASKIEKYFDKMSADEQNEALNRIDVKQKLQRALNNEAQLVSQGKSKTDAMMEKMGKVTNFAEKGIGMYNVIAKINNAFNSDSFMPTIGGEWAGDRKKKLLKEAKEEAEKAREKAKKEKEDREEEQRKKFLEKASAREILANPEKVRLNEWEAVGKKFNTQEKLIQKIQAQGDAHRKIGVDFSNKYMGLQTKRLNSEIKQHEKEMEEIAKKYGFDYVIDPKYKDRWRN